MGTIECVCDPPIPLAEEEGSESVGVPGVSGVCKPGLRLQSANAERALMQAMVANARCQLGERPLLGAAGIAPVCEKDSDMHNARCTAM